MAYTTPKPSPHGQQKRTYDSSQTIAWGAVSIATSLLLSGIAHTHTSLQTDSLVWLLLIPLFLGQLMAVVGTTTSIENGWPGRGMQIFASGMVGLGLGVACVSWYRLSDSFLGFVTWGLAGMHMGWLCECLTGAFGTLAAYLNTHAPVNKRES